MSKIKKQILISQGDINFIPYTGKIEGEKQIHDGSFAVAWGEVSNHAHRVTVADPKDMEVRKLPNGEYLLILTSEATLSHEEHSAPEGYKTQVLSPGTYLTGGNTGEREYDWFALETKRVID